jgi:hypothetical protein
LDLPDELRKRGVANTFHVSLLRPYVPSDDTRFPGRRIFHITDFSDDPKEWEVDHIVTHQGKGSSAMFQVKWALGDSTWEEYNTVKDLTALDEYLELVGAKNIEDVPHARASSPTLSELE